MQRLDLLCIPPVVGVSRLLVHDTLFTRIGCCLVFDLSTKELPMAKKAKKKKAKAKKKK